MAVIKIYGYKGMIVAKPFQVNSADDEPEAMTEEEKQIINYAASDSDKQVDQVADDTGN